MTRATLFCTKCEFEAPSFDTDDNYGFSKAMDGLKSHIKEAHPLVRKPHDHINWRYSGYKAQ